MLLCLICTYVKLKIDCASRFRQRIGWLIVKVILLLMTTSKEFFTIGSQGEYGVALSTVYYPSVPNSCFKANIISQRKLLKKVKTHAPQYLCDSENKITEIFERLFATWQQASVAVGQRKAKR